MDSLEIRDVLDILPDDDDEFQSMINIDWQNHDPPSVFIALSKFEVVELKSVEGNRKTEAHVKRVVHKLPSSYSSNKVNFDSLSDHQKNVVLKMWKAAPDNQREEILRLSDTIHQSKLENNNSIHNIPDNNEMARIIHLTMWPGARTYMTVRRSSMDREAMDSHHSGGDGEARRSSDPDYYLSEIYNNFENDEDFNIFCRNPAVAYANNKKIVPLESSKPTVEGFTYDLIFDIVKNIDATPDGVDKFRSPQWIGSQIRRMEKIIGQIKDNYFRSGLQDGCNPYCVWPNYCNRGGPAWEKYAILVLDIGELKHMGYK